jgi:hypothetical protein
MFQRRGLHPIKLICGSLFHPWFKRGTLPESVGRNLAVLIARVGLKLGMGDNFCYMLKNAG